MELKGKLGEFNLPSIIQLLEYTGKTGALRIAHGDGRSALYFEQGRVVHAEHPGCDGEEAVYCLLRVPEGDFWFLTEPPLQNKTLTMSAMQLVLEAARLQDESSRDDEPDEWRPWVLEEEDDWFGIKD